MNDGVALTSARHPPSEQLIEAVCRSICRADRVDPDATGVGLGDRMPAGSTYPLWQARREQAIEAIYTVWDSLGLDEPA